MGFRCPICGEDFGKDKDLLYAHAKICNSGISEYFMNYILNTCEKIIIDDDDERNEHSNEY